MLDSGGATTTVNTLLIRRLASEVVASDDVVAAWAQVEALREELRRKDGELSDALGALAAAPMCAESPRSAAAHRETAGQQLARFLKDQLAARDAQLEAAAMETAAARRKASEHAAALAASEAARRELEAALVEAQAALTAAQGGWLFGFAGCAGLRSGSSRSFVLILRCAALFGGTHVLFRVHTRALSPAAAEAHEHAEAASLARREADEARREAGAQAQQAQQLRSELWAMEAHANLAGYGTPEGGPIPCGAIWPGCEMQT